MTSPGEIQPLEVEAPPAPPRPPVLRRAWDGARARWARHVAIATLVIGAVAATGHFIGGMIGWWHLYEVFHKPARPAAPAPVAGHALSIVMLPLVDESGGPESGLADVITGDVITNLGQLTATMVISRDTAFTYRGRKADAREVARDLGVRYVVSGTMRREADRVHLNLAMVDGGSGLQHWSQSFTLKRSELDEGLRTVSAQIGRSLSVELMKVAAKRTVALRPDQVEADDIAIRGWGVYFRGWTKENAVESLRLFEQAVERDPKSIRGWGGVGTVNGQMAFTATMGVDRPTALKRMDEALARLQALDSDDPMTHTMRLLTANLRDDFGALLQAAENLRQRYPSHPRAFSAKAVALTYLGRTDECLEPGRHALRIDPGNPTAGFMHVQLAVCHFMRAEYAQAAESARAGALATPSLVAPHVLRAAALAQLGKQEEARAALDEYRRKRAGATSETAGRTIRGDSEKSVASRQLLVSTLQALGLP